MGRKKREILGQFYNEINRMFDIISKIAYDNCEKINISSDLLNSKIVLGSNQIFIKRETKLYLEARRHFEDYIYRFNLNAEGILINKSSNDKTVKDAQILAAELSDISNSIVL